MHHSRGQGLASDTDPDAAGQCSAGGTHAVRGRGWGALTGVLQQFCGGGGVTDEWAAAISERREKSWLVRPRLKEKISKFGTEIGILQNSTEIDSARRMPFQTQSF
jgi:hypothetical protein